MIQQEASENKFIGTHWKWVVATTALLSFSGNLLPFGGLMMDLKEVQDILGDRFFKELLMFHLPSLCITGLGMIFSLTMLLRNRLAWISTATILISLVLGWVWLAIQAEGWELALATKRELVMHVTTSLLQLSGLALLFLPANLAVLPPRKWRFVMLAVVLGMLLLAIQLKVQDAFMPF